MLPRPTWSLVVGASGVCAVVGVFFEKYHQHHQEDGSILSLPKLAAAISESAGVVPNQQLQPPYGSTRRINQIVRFGYPNQTDVKVRSNYVLSYDRRTRVANWVLEHINRDLLKTSVADRNQCPFVEDLSLHPYYRAKNDDFRRSGYDRGHLAAAANHKFSQEACAETFFLSNIAPQVGEGFNQGAWMYLEKFVRYLANRNSNVYLCTGPLYLPRRETDGKLYVKYEVIGLNHVAVPTHFFKVVVVESMDGEYFVLSFVLPNQKIDPGVQLKAFLTDLEVIERASGLLFFQHNPSYKDLIKPAPSKFLEGFRNS